MIFYISLRCPSDTVSAAIFMIIGVYSTNSSNINISIGSEEINSIPNECLMEFQ